MNQFITNGLFEFSYIRSRSFDSDVISFIQVPQEIEPNLTIELNKEKNLYNIKEKETEKKISKNSILTSKKEEEMKKQNPLFWFVKEKFFFFFFKLINLIWRFGLLPSSDLIKAQSNFKQACFQASELASIRSKMTKIENEFKNIK